MARISISMPVYMRPQRTRRAIRSILAQTMPDFEAIVIGDHCPYFMENIIRMWIDKDERFIAHNLSINFGGCGYHATNLAIKAATAPYFCFMANDDVIHPGHLQNYLHAIEGTDYDFVYFDYMQGDRRINAKIRKDRIGHAALVIRTDFLRQMPPHEQEYGHDNVLIDNMIRAGAKYKKAQHFPATYQIMNYNKARADLEGLD